MYELQARKENSGNGGVLLVGYLYIDAIERGFGIDVVGQLDLYADGSLGFGIILRAGFDPVVGWLDVDNVLRLDVI